jgi:inner membrane protein
MDTITHTLFGLTLYGAVDKREMSKEMKKAALFTAIGASQIPDIDVISQLWDSEGMYQMWHRGITHSLFMMPLWAFLFMALSFILFKVKSWRLFFLALLAVFIHSTSDLFNAWGTGYFEPFSQKRITFGTIPIIDFIIWFIIFTAFFLRKRWRYPRHQLYRAAWGLIALHFIIQSAQGYVLYQAYSKQYEQLTLSASFLPWHFHVIGKNKATVDIISDSLFGQAEKKYTLHSKEDADLNTLFEKRPEAKTLYEWAPFVVIVDDEERLGIYDPRFYRNGQSFLFEYIEK